MVCWFNVYRISGVILPAFFSEIVFVYFFFERKQMCLVFIDRSVCCWCHIQACSANDAVLCIGWWLHCLRQIEIGIVWKCHYLWKLPANFACLHYLCCHQTKLTFWHV